MADSTTIASKIKIAPNSKESEMMVLGCMLTSINSLNIAADALDDSDFYFTEHKIIFQVLKNAYKNDKPADLHLICEELKRIDKLAAVGGVAYMTTLAQYAGTSAYIEEYTELVKSKSLLRRMINAAQVVEKMALEDPANVHIALDEAQQIFFKISQAANPLSGVLIKDLLSGVKSLSTQPFLKELQERQERFQTKGPGDLGITGLPTHFIDVDKLLNGLTPSNLMILAARPAMGKCVAKGTPIIDPETGALVPIEELVEKGRGKVATLSNDWKLKSVAPSAFVADGVKPTFQVTTALGKELEATAVHPLLTLKGWKRVEELKVGDRIAVPRQLPFFGTRTWPDHELKVLAYLIADGNLTNNQPRFTNQNPKIIEDFKKAALAFGSVRIREDKRDDRCPTFSVALDRSEGAEIKAQFAQAIQNLSVISKKALFQLLKRLGLCQTNVYAWGYGTSLPSYNTALALEEYLPEIPSTVSVIRENPVTALLIRLGLLGKNAYEKFLPRVLFELTKENLALFINRLFSCDGTAYIATCGGRPFPVIAYASASKKLIYHVQHLLLRFGILSKVRKKNTICQGKRFPSFELEIHGKADLIRFCQEIGIYGKEAAVEAVLTYSLEGKIGWSKDTLPLDIWTLIRQKKGSRKWADLFRAKGFPAPSNLHEGKRQIRRDTLAKLAYVLDDEELRQIASSDVYWDRITEIVPTGEKEVFDLTVEHSHNFVAGDMIVHNTAMALNIAESVCFKEKIPVGIFSLEMTAEQVLQRLICSQSQVESEKLKTGSLNGLEFQRIVATVNEMQNHTMVIDDQPGLKITDLRARARRMKESYQVGLLIVDYLQLLSGSGAMRSVENRQNEISEISRMLKNLARELNLPILCLSQLSRKVEDRTGHRPMMSDLRESGCLTGDTLITEANTGKRIPIKELVNQPPILVEAVDSQWKIGTHLMSKVFSSGIKMVYELKTRMGRSIKASANHPFLKLEGWTRLDALKVGMHIAIKTSSTNSPRPSYTYSLSSVEATQTAPTAVLETQITLDEIVSITLLGEEEVFDATVENVHNFVANDIIVHNSIEQDADIVMFLLRREYYDPKDKPGMAELIIAKNRHGGVGNINLTFRKEIAQFANYTPIQNQISHELTDPDEAFKAFTPT